jgi:hypothetical protein
MAFGGNKFKSACHQRAMNVAIVAAGDPVCARVVTEHSASFPDKDGEDCYIHIAVKSDGEVLATIQKTKYFSLSLLTYSQMQDARDIYAGNVPHSKVTARHHVPYFVEANTVLICSLFKTVDLGVNTLIIGHVFEAIIADTPEKPLVNYIKYYCSVDDERMPVENPNVKNTRLEDDQPPAP